MPKQVLCNDSVKLNEGVEGVEAAHKLIVKTFLSIEVLELYLSLWLLSWAMLCLVGCLWVFSPCLFAFGQFSALVSFSEQ